LPQDRAARTPPPTAPSNDSARQRGIFEMKNRKRFCGRIATGDYDAVIIGHSQFEKIPISIERQRAVLEQQLSDIIEGIADIKRNLKVAALHKKVGRFLRLCLSDTAHIPHFRVKIQILVIMTINQERMMS